MVQKWHVLMPIDGLYFYDFDKTTGIVCNQIPLTINSAIVKFRMVLNFLQIVKFLCEFI